MRLSEMIERKALAPWHGGDSWQELIDGARDLERERDAARAEAARLRAAHAETLAGLRRIEAYMAPHPAEGNMALAVAFGMVRAAIKRAECGAQARGERGAK